MTAENTFFDSTNHLNDAGVAMYVDALKLDVLDQVPGDVRDHVSECQKCKKEITGLYTLLMEEDYTSLKSHPYFSLGRRGAGSRVRFAYRIAAVIGALALTGILAYYVANRGSTRPGVEAHRFEPIQGEDTGRIAAPPEASGVHDSAALAARYEPYPELENMVNGAFRSGEIEVRSPKNGIVAGDSLWFDLKDGAWSGLIVTIVSNRGENLYSAHIVSAPFALERPSAPGLYYWKLQNAGELVYVGKFFVK
ncbi:MAG TPA: hypothetical protein VL221_09445 [Bacteroidota bacterium]|nr:hypothetical protein [Bacteroidota bacterium]